METTIAITRSKSKFFELRAIKNRSHCRHSNKASSSISLETIKGCVLVQLTYHIAVTCKRIEMIKTACSESSWSIRQDIDHLMSLCSKRNECVLVLVSVH